MTRLEEALQKACALREYLKKERLQGALITQQPNFSYMTAGGRGFLGLASTVACAMLLITRDQIYLLANAIEAPRLMKEEIPEGLCQLKALPWQEDGGLRVLAQDLAGGQVADDGQLAGYFQSARLCLNEPERQRYRVLGRESARAFEDTLLQTKPGDSEFVIAGRIASALWAIGAEPISLFIAADDHAMEVRHFVPTARKAYHKVIASICARRHGLVISATRSIALNEITAAWQDRYDRLLQVEAAMLGSIVPGQPLKNCYEAACAAYEAQGMPGEFNHHHQGGLAGYLPREIRMDGKSACFMAPGQAFAFNPSCPGAKAEDTALLTENGLEILSDSGAWPMRKIAGFDRPRIACIRKE